MAIEGRPPPEWPSFDRLCGNRVDTAESSETDVRLQRPGAYPLTLGRHVLDRLKIRRS